MKTEYLTDTPYYTEADLANLKPPEATHEPILINDRVDSVSKNLPKVQRKWEKLSILSNLSTVALAKHLKEPN